MELSAAPLPEALPTLALAPVAVGVSSDGMEGRAAHLAKLRAEVEALRMQEAPPSRHGKLSSWEVYGAVVVSSCIHVQSYSLFNAEPRSY